MKTISPSFKYTIAASLIALSLASDAVAAQPPPRPRIPEPLSPLFPTPGMPPIPGLPPKGDAQRGERLYHSWGCPSCHTLDGKGGKLGPDLARVGETQTDPYWYRRYLTEPRSIIPTSVKPPVRLSDADMDDLVAYLLGLKKFRTP